MRVFSGLHLLSLLAFSYAQTPAVSDDCSQAMCDVLAQMLTCEAFGIGMPRICAKHLLGSQGSCPKFPKDILNAPYICKKYYDSLSTVSKIVQLAKEAKSPDTLESIISPLGLIPSAEGSQTLADALLNAVGLSPLGYASFNELCGVTCFHNYLILVNQLFYTCATAPINTVSATETSLQGMPDPSSITAVQCEMCASNPTIQLTCLDALDSSSPMDFRCPYPEPQLPAVQAQLCATFAPLGCCFSTIVSFGQQSAGTVLPPCILQMLQGCPAPVTTSDFCLDGLMTNISTITATYTFVENDPSTFVLPNMYNETQVKKFMDALAHPLAENFGIAGVTGDMFTVVSFTYTTEDGTPITSFSQVQTAASATYTFQLSLFGSESPVLISKLNALIPTAGYASQVAVAYGIGGLVVPTSSLGQPDFFLVPMEYIPDTAAPSSFSYLHSLLFIVAVAFSLFH